jgi:3-phenylpropionate/cinnamic acid dioxygenase small subunit
MNLVPERGTAVPVTIEAIADRIAIQELTARYNRCFDDQDIGAWVELFVPDGGIVLPDGVDVVGHRALASLCRSTGWGTVHATTDHMIDVVADEATQTCTLLLARRTRNPTTSSFSLTGRYHDRLVRTPSGWRFSMRRIQLDGSI